MPVGLAVAGVVLVWFILTRNGKRLASGISIRAAFGKRLRFRATLGHGTLTITLAGAASTVQVTIAKPAITVTETLVREAKLKQVRRLSSGVKVTDSVKATTRLTQAARL